MGISDGDDKLASCLLPFLNTGMTVAVFKSPGRIRLKMISDI